MAFGDVYGYKTNSRFVAAVAESEERESNPDYVDETETPEEESRLVVDLVLLGFANGRRNNVVVADDSASAEVNQAVAAPVTDGSAPGDTTADNDAYSGGSSDQ